MKLSLTITATITPQIVLSEFRVEVVDNAGTMVLESVNSLPVEYDSPEAEEIMENKMDEICYGILNVFSPDVDPFTLPASKWVWEKDTNAPTKRPEWLLDWVK